MNDQPPDGRSQFAIAYQWAWRIISISLEMVIPGVLGIFVDRWLGTLVVFTLLGFGFGMTAGLWHLIKLTAAKDRSVTNESGNAKQTRSDDKLT